MLASIVFYLVREKQYGAHPRMKKDPVVKFSPICILWCNLLSSKLFLLQSFLRCRPEEAELDLEGEKAALFSKEIAVALRQWILPVYVSGQIICESYKKLVSVCHVSRSSI